MQKNETSREMRFWIGDGVMANGTGLYSFIWLFIYSYEFA